MRFVFIITHALLGLVALKAGIESYWQWSGNWDAGVMPLFISFWFFFSGIGFYKKNVWLVSTSSLALAGFLALYLFINFLDYFQKGFNLSATESLYFIAGLAVMGIIFAGEVYAIWQFRQKRKGPAG